MFQENQGFRVYADRLRRAIRDVERFMARVGSDFREADVPEALGLLGALRQACRISPNTHPRRVLLARGKHTAFVLAQVVREMRRARPPSPSMDGADASGLVAGLPDAGLVRDVVPERVYGPDGFVGPLQPAPVRSEHYWRKLTLAQQGALSDYMETRKRARKAYEAAGRGALVRRKYMQSAKGKAARKRANARYYAKRKEKSNSS